MGLPRTRKSLTGDLRSLGVHAGATVLVHASLRSLGWVCGGPVTVVHALLDVLGPDGTVVVPTHTADNSEPAGWRNPPVPAQWWPIIRANTPAFDPALTPSTGIGVLPETVRTWPEARRSVHPQTSFAALGADAQEVVAGHDLDCRLGERSPLGTLERLDAQVLLLGVGYSACTAFHLAEYRVPGLRRETWSAAVQSRPGRQHPREWTREWVTHDDVALDSADFPALGADFEAAGAVRSGLVGDATARLFAVREAVAFATRWIAGVRPQAPAAPAT